VQKWHLFLDGSQITTITATHDDFFNIYYRQGEHFLKEFLAISIPSFLRNPNRSGLVKPKTGPAAYSPENTVHY
jgi:hypothetical protein